MATGIEDLRATALGAASGVVATAAMSAVMVGAQRAGLMGELPPHAIARQSVERTPGPDETTPETKRRLGWLAHFGFGAAIGGLYGLLRRRVRTPGPAAFHGGSFALAVWAVSYLGWIPALNFLPSATEDEPGRPPTMIAAHLVFGALVGVIVERGLGPRRPALDPR